MRCSWCGRSLLWSEIDENRYDVFTVAGQLVYACLNGCAEFCEGCGDEKRFIDGRFRHTRTLTVNCLAPRPQPVPRKLKNQTQLCKACHEPIVVADWAIIINGRIGNIRPVILDVTPALNGHIVLTWIKDSKHPLASARPFRGDDYYYHRHHCAGRPSDERTQEESAETMRQRAA